MVSSLSLVCPAGRVDSVVIDSDVTNYTLSSLFPATEYEISLIAVRGSQESKVVTTSVFTGGNEQQSVIKTRWLIAFSVNWVVKKLWGNVICSKPTGIVVCFQSPIVQNLNLLNLQLCRTRKNSKSSVCRGGCPLLGFPSLVPLLWTCPLKRLRQPLLCNARPL